MRPLEQYNPATPTPAAAANQPPRLDLANLQRSSRKAQNHPGYKIQQGTVPQQQALFASGSAARMQLVSPPPEEMLRRSSAQRGASAITITNQQEPLFTPSSLLAIRGEGSRISIGHGSVSMGSGMDTTTATAKRKRDTQQQQQARGGLIRTALNPQGGLTAARLGESSSRASVNAAASSSSSSASSFVIPPPSSVAVSDDYGAAPKGGGGGGGVGWNEATPNPRVRKQARRGRSPSPSRVGGRGEVLVSTRFKGKGKGREVDAAEEEDGQEDGQEEEEEEDALYLGGISFDEIPGTPGPRWIQSGSGTTPRRATGRSSAVHRDGNAGGRGSSARKRKRVVVRTPGSVGGGRVERTVVLESTSTAEAAEVVLEEEMSFALGGGGEEEEGERTPRAGSAKVRGRGKGWDLPPSSPEHYALRDNDRDEGEEQEPEEGASEDGTANWDWTKGPMIPMGESTSDHEEEDFDSVMYMDDDDGRRDGGQAPVEVGMFDFDAVLRARAEGRRVVVVDNEVPADDGWGSSSEGDDLDLDLEGGLEGTGEYTGRWRMMWVRTKEDPPSEATMERMEEWGRPVSPFPGVRRLSVGEGDEGPLREDDGGNEGGDGLGLEVGGEGEGDGELPTISTSEADALERELPVVTTSEADALAVGQHERRGREQGEDGQEEDDRDEQELPTISTSEADALERELPIISTSEADALDLEFGVGGGLVDGEEVEEEEGLPTITTSEADAVERRQDEGDVYEEEEEEEEEEERGRGREEQRSEEEVEEEEREEENEVERLSMEPEEEAEEEGAGRATPTKDVQSVDDDDVDRMSVDPPDFAYPAAQQPVTPVQAKRKLVNPGGGEEEDGEDGDGRDSRMQRQEPPSSSGSSATTSVLTKGLKRVILSPVTPEPAWERQRRIQQQQQGRGQQGHRVQPFFDFSRVGPDDGGGGGGRVGVGGEEGGEEVGQEEAIVEAGVEDEVELDEDGEVDEGGEEEEGEEEEEEEDGDLEDEGPDEVDLEEEEQGAEEEEEVYEEEFEEPFTPRVRGKEPVYEEHLVPVKGMESSEDDRGVDVDADAEVEEDAEVIDDVEEEEEAKAEEEDDSSDDLDDLDLGMVKIVSADPRAAARAAAILKQYDYECFTKETIKQQKQKECEKRRYSSLDERSQDSRRRSLLSSGGVSKSAAREAAVKERNRRRSTLGMGVIGDRVVIPGSPSMTMPELLEQVEREVLEVGPMSPMRGGVKPLFGVGGHGGEGLGAEGGFSTPVGGGEREMRNPFETPQAGVMRRVEVPAAMVAWNTAPSAPLVEEEEEEVKTWTKEEWKILDSCLTDERMGEGHGGYSPYTQEMKDVDEVDVDAVVERFVEMVGGEDVIQGCGDAWSRDVLRKRVVALQKKQRAGHVAPPTTPSAATPIRTPLSKALGGKNRRVSMEVPDFTPLARARAQPPARARKVSPLTQQVEGVEVENADNANAPSPPSSEEKRDRRTSIVPQASLGPRYADLINEARDISAEVSQLFAQREVEAVASTAAVDTDTLSDVGSPPPVDRGDVSIFEPESTAPETSAPRGDAVDSSFTTPAAPAGLGKTLKGIFFSYMPTLSKTAPPPRRQPQEAHPGLPLPPPELLQKARGPVRTPARKPLPKPKHPKELVELHPPPPPKQSKIPRLKPKAPQRLVKLNRVPPPQQQEKKQQQKRPVVAVASATAPGVENVRPRRSSAASVKDLVKGFEEIRKVEERSNSSLGVRRPGSGAARVFAAAGTLMNLSRPGWKP